MRYWPFLAVVLLLIIPTSSALAIPRATMTIEGNSITVEYLNTSPAVIDPSTPGYGAESTTITIDGQDYDGIALSNDGNTSGGIADTHGDVEVTLELDDRRPFCFAIYGGAGGRSRLDFDLTINGITSSYPASLTSNSGWLYVGSDGTYTSIGALDSAGAWFSSDTVVTIDIDSTGRIKQGVTLTIVFQG